MRDELMNPPYPGEACTSENLYKYLGDLRDWVLNYRDEINSTVGSEVVPAVGPLGKKLAYLAQPVPQLYMHLMYLRKLREEWDHVVRLYEDDWEDKFCVRARAMLVQSAAVQLNEAFVPQEVREAKAQKHMEKMQKAFESLNALFSKMAEPKSDQEESR